MNGDEVPSDVWTVVSSHLVLPKHHIALSQTCQSSRAVYLLEEKWKQICRSMGVGRASGEANIKWKTVFWQVYRHRHRCRIPLCYQYGAPAMKSVGDLLPSAQAVLEHFQYFKENHVCNCGGCHHEDDDEEDDEDTEGESNSDDDDDDSEEGSDEDEEDDDDWEDDTAPNPMGLFPGASNDPMAAMMSNMMASMLGMGGGPVPPLPPMFMGGGGGPMPPFPPFPPMYQNPATAAANLDTLATLPFQPPAVKPKSKKKAKSTSTAPKPRAHLLPLSWKNRADVPNRPILHPFLVETGSVQFQRFLMGKMALQAQVSLGPPGPLPFLPVGIDWEEAVDPKGLRRNPDLVDVQLHPLLSRAYATNPPVTDIRFELDTFSTHVTNPDGVTIRDCITQLGRYFASPMTLGDRAALCSDPTPHVCDVTSCKTRIQFITRTGAKVQQAPGFPKTGIKECWFRGISRLDGGQVVCELIPN
ncbi:uncharacterized protein MKK02DRAFT_43580 [Dioszegia hungarica]|uniref:Uncharacterized protein n=1 Tax=Dioszegia hungarica TaxID=4972 RepID=A0AA38HEC5_9TREE|nr:uncharacterized protein MKK02DRAFT_43580 [Dioszegia hungarica]KAI9637654.1 hypothetical protein MKK02DRAFT_43580 [Dioszegia hungarica]